jgi:hypothetical protein
MDSYLLVIDQLRGEADQTFDWLYHNSGTAAQCEATGAAGKFDVVGAQFLQNIRQGTSDSAVHVQFSGEGLTTYLTVDGQAGTIVRTADGPRETVMQRVPLAVISREGRNVCFVAVIEPVPQGSQRAVTSLQVERRGDDALTVTIRRGHEADVVSVEARSLSVQISGKPALGAKRQ